MVIFVSAHHELVTNFTYVCFFDYVVKYKNLYICVLVNIAFVRLL